MHTKAPSTRTAMSMTTTYKYVLTFSLFFCYFVYVSSTLVGVFQD